jgi:KDO2-lipid IV(A) lauroyltransferase
MPLKLLRVTAAMSGFLLFRIPPFRKLIIANIKTAFPEKTDCEIRKIASANARHLALTVLEFFWFAGKEKVLESITDETGVETVFTKELKKSGEGLIWVAPHIGNWELAGFHINNKTKVPFAVVVRAQNNFLINRFIRRARTSVGNIIIEDRGAVKGMIKALKEGYFLATLVDQNTKARDGGIFVDFFGLPVPTSRAPAFFARKLGVNVALGGCVRNGERYMIFSERLSKKTSEYNSDEEMTQEILKLTEKIIRQYPEQYLWMYKRWQFIPKDISPELAKKYPYYATPATERFYDERAPKT